MLGLNVIFHVMSLLVLIALLAVVAHLRHRLFFDRKLLAAVDQSRGAQLHVDWLHRFLKSLMYALNLPELPKEQAELLPKIGVRFDLGPWARLHHNYGIRGISCSAQSPAVVITVKLARIEAVTSAEFERLFTALRAGLPDGVLLRCEGEGTAHR